MTLVKKTSREHYEKYAKISKERGVRWTRESASLVGRSHAQLVEAFERDSNLNNIPLATWDAFAYSMMPQSGGLSLAECVCLQKHCAIYQCIGAVPEFEAGS